MISSIIVTYNSAATIEQSITSLKEALSGWESEIIVIDNASRDNTVSLIENTHSADIIIRNAINLGFAGGVNTGLSAAKGSHLLLINPDLVINADCVNGMMDYLDTNPAVGAVGPKLLYQNGEIQPSRRKYPTLRGMISSKLPFLTRIIGRRYLYEYWMYDISFTIPTDVDWLIGACMMTTIECLCEVGYYDDRFFLYFEDADWCYRARQYGYRICYLPNVQATHYYHRESSNGLNMALIHHFASTVRLLLKHGLTI